MEACVAIALGLCCWIIFVLTLNYVCSCWSLTLQFGLALLISFYKSQLSGFASYQTFFPAVFFFSQWNRKNIHTNYFPTEAFSSQKSKVSNGLAFISSVWMMLLSYVCWINTESGLMVWTFSNESCWMASSEISKNSYQQQWFLQFFSYFS